MAGLGIGASSTCCAPPPFDCATCFNSTWPATLYLSDPLGTITLTRSTVGGFTSYKFAGTRTATGYEYCWSSGPTSLDIFFSYSLSCSGSSLLLGLSYYQCVPKDYLGNNPFTSSFVTRRGTFGDPDQVCGTDGVPACFGATYPLIAEPGSLVKYRTAYIHTYPSPASCLIETGMVGPGEDSTLFGNGCYASNSPTSSTYGTFDAFGGDVPGLSTKSNTSIPAPTTCSSVVNLSLVMTIPDNFTNGTVTITS